MIIKLAMVTLSIPWQNLLGRRYLNLLIDCSLKRHRLLQKYDIHSDILSISKESDTDINFKDIVPNLKKYEIFPIPKPMFCQHIQHSQRRRNLQSCLL